MAKAKSTAPPVGAKNLLFGGKKGGAGLAGLLLGAGFVPSPQSNYNPMRPTPFVPPKGKGKGKKG
jgi:hypothetical protein